MRLSKGGTQEAVSSHGGVYAWPKAICGGFDPHVSVVLAHPHLSLLEIAFRHTKFAKKQQPEAIGPTSLLEIAFRHTKLAKKDRSKEMWGNPLASPSASDWGTSRAHTSAHFAHCGGCGDPPQHLPRWARASAHFRAPAGPCRAHAPTSA